MPVRCLLVSFIVILGQSTGIAQAIGHTNEWNFRRNAVLAVTPAYPADALRSRASGVVVAQLTMNPSGVPDEIRIVQAPCQAIVNSVLDALKQWRFAKPLRHVTLTGKLYFYFVMDEANRGQVLSAEEAWDRGIRLPLPAPVSTSKTGLRSRR